MNREMDGKVAKGDSGGARAGAGRRQATARLPCQGGFTLVELLVVMGIIAILVSLLFPAITGAIVAVRKAATLNVINTLGVALDAFRNDWGVYPPSDNDSQHDTPTNDARETTEGKYGYYNLCYFLAGPEQKGWGANYLVSGTPTGPFGGSATKAYPPYYLPDKAADMQWVDSSGPPHQGYADAFKPGRGIFYFRYEPGDTNPYDVNDNPLSTNGATGPPLLGFASQNHFNLLVTVPNPVDLNKKRWVRDDYLLISCGADRYWGYVKPPDASGNVTPAITTADSGATCDDVTNFSYSR